MKLLLPVDCVVAICHSCTTAVGTLETMLMVMMIDTPLPMPRSVTCSPIHMKTIVVQVSTTVVTNTKTVGDPRNSGEAGSGSPRRLGLIMPIDTIAPCTTHTAIVR